MAGERGFTLLEILVALVVLGFLMLALSQGVQFGLRAWRAQARIVTEYGDLDAVDRTLRTLIGRMDPGSMAEPTLLRGQEHTASFTTELPLVARQLPTRLADVTLALDPAHRLSLFWVPHVRTWIGPPRVPDRADLATGVERIELSYWPRTGGWATSWNARELPALIRIRLVFPEASHMHWPDIVAAPMRDRARS